MANYPSTISSFNYPAATDRLNNPSHSALENSQSSVITQIQAVVGLSGDAPGTIIGDLRSSSSDGGGHVQSANKGGTGQTSYTKGDILVATSSSVLSKLAVSSTAGEFLTVDTSQPGGMKWGASGTKVYVGSSVVNIDRWQGSVANVLFAASILGSTLGTSNAIKYTGIFNKYNVAVNENFTVVVNYGTGSIATIPMIGGGSVISSGARVEGTIINNNAVTSQLGYARFIASNNFSEDSAFDGATIAMGGAYGTSSVNSTLNQDLIITGQFAGTGAKNSILTGFFTVEKIS